ncbi:hypothetical protein DL771_009820 [Monosporascus sp. 5C6A]|nr:hypothetical protein DL771_009820 [Monosporascus sp. 5C6A]
MVAAGRTGATSFEQVFKAVPRTDKATEADVVLRELRYLSGYKLTNAGRFFTEEGVFVSRTSKWKLKKALHEAKGLQGTIIEVVYEMNSALVYAREEVNTAAQIVKAELNGAAAYSRREGSGRLDNVDLAMSAGKMAVGFAAKRRLISAAAGTGVPAGAVTGAVMGAIIGSVILAVGAGAKILIDRFW